MQAFSLSEMLDTEIDGQLVHARCQLIIAHLRGLHPKQQSAILAYLLAQWLAGWSLEGEQQVQVRTFLLEQHLNMVTKLADGLSTLHGAHEHE